MGTIIREVPCPKCREEGRDRSGDNLKIYDDGSGYCFSSHGWFKLNKHIEYEEDDKLTDFNSVAQLPIASLRERGIGVEEARKYGVRVEYCPNTGEDAKYYFPLYENGQVVGWQAKTARKPGSREQGDVTRLVAEKGASRNALPFGSQIAGDGGKFLIVVEGGEDALAASAMLSQLLKNWRVVGALGTDAWKRNLDWYMNFEKVVIAFDPDAGGRKAAAEFADALGHRAWIATLPADPNEMLINGLAAKFVACVSNPKQPMVDGFITGETVWERMKNYTKPETIPFPDEWEQIKSMMEGIRMGEISMWTAGSSIGKTSYIRRLKQHIVHSHPNYKVAEIELEEAPEKTFRGMMQFEGGKKWFDMTPDERRAAYEATYGTQRIITLDHRAYNKDAGSLLKKMYHSYYTLGCQVIFLDHITIAVTEFGDGEGNAAQDKMMNDFLTFVEKTKAHLCLVSHLRKTGVGARDYEKGMVPTKADLKGSGSLQQISFDIIGVSRNMQHEDLYERDVSQMHVLKCRELGRTGPADRMYWDDQHQMLLPARPPLADEEF